MHPVPPRSSPNVAAATTTRVHPSDTAHVISVPAAADDQPPPPVYTVWKRSSMGFQGTDGFSVYDADGALAFRVDNYSRRRKLFAGELLLMDGHGAPLLALRPQDAPPHQHTMPKFQALGYKEASGGEAARFEAAMVRWWPG
nr:unnamed protein product [Digitaria exilis]